jgi:hypothetical protein
MCKTPEAAAVWADKVLEEFDNRFKEQDDSKPFIETDKFIIKSKT